MEQDWRLNGQEEYLQNAVLYKVVFPDFWKALIATKNAFYKMIEGGLVTYVRNADGTLSIAEKEPMTIDEAALDWHEHCDFCWEKAMTNMECEFYCTKDMEHWICKECFEDFKDKFGWIVKSADELFA